MNKYLAAILLVLLSPSILYGGMSLDKLDKEIRIPIKGSYLIDESSIELCATDKEHEFLDNVCEIEEFKLFTENIDLNNFYNQIHFFNSKPELNSILTNKIFSKTLSNNNAWDFEGFDYAIVLVNYVSNEFIDQVRLVNEENIFSLYYEIWRSKNERVCPCLWSQLFVIKLKRI